MILLHFPNPLDSPTQATPVRLRYAIEHTPQGARPILRYAHGSRQLTADAWHGYQAAGATMTATTERERSIVWQCLRHKATP